MENQLAELTSLVRQLAVRQQQITMAAKIYGICTSVEHPTDMCPTLQATESDQVDNVGAIGRFQYGKQSYQNQPFDNQQHGRQPFRPGLNQGPYAAQQFGSTPNAYQRQQSVSSNNMQFHQNLTTTIEDLKTQIRQLANTVSHLQLAGSSNLPSQTIPNPRGNANVVTLKSGKELPQPTLQQLPRSAEADSEPNADSQPRPETTVLLPFPTRTISPRKPKSDEELLKMFRKVEINIPLLGAIK
ncbi:hypothetical protein CR513_50540, partial [Mucuna pruriens]